MHYIKSIVAVSDMNVLLNNNNIMYGINNLSTNSFTVLRDKTFLLMNAFGEGFVLINMETKSEK